VSSEAGWPFSAGINKQLADLAEDIDLVNTSEATGSEYIRALVEQVRNSQNACPLARVQDGLARAKQSGHPYSALSVALRANLNYYAFKSSERGRTFPTPGLNQHNMVATLGVWLMSKPRTAYRSVGCRDPHVVGYLIVLTLRPAYSRLPDTQQSSAI